MRKLYTLLLYLLAPLVILRLAWRSLRAPDYRRRWPERFGTIEPALGEQVIWIHAVSVGEVQAAEPVVQALLEQRPDYSILITTVTPTGSARVTALFGDEVAHVYAPYDLPGAVSRFFQRVRPQLAIVMETELWPNLFHACQQRAIPLLLINARLSERSEAGYRRVRGLAAQTLSAVNEIAAQSELDAGRFINIGADQGTVTVTGNLKFEQRVPPSLLERAEVLRRDWGVGRTVWVAGSTHEGEDELLLDAFRQLRERFSDCLLVLVPRHPERFESVAELCRQKNYNTLLRSAAVPCTPATEVYIGDSMGELPLFYAASDVAFVGGSLVPHGGHNMLEPAALGVPVVTGPHVFNFVEICELLQQAGACVKVENVGGLSDTLSLWLEDANQRHRVGQRGRDTVEKNRGALQSVMAMIDRYL
ncbi:MAG: lipid IV(A) 3-deoxy-D-manno-octulosonic acid transferase [Gammaproteobacteria bacterium]|nr:lipid IV(A) 3-deoxy-D-manno-octulosonic acid transferase [Gammaproteobacteria bacterium]